MYRIGRGFNERWPVSPVSAAVMLHDGGHEVGEASRKTLEGELLLCQEPVSKIELPFIRHKMQPDLTVDI